MITSKVTLRLIFEIRSIEFLIADLFEMRRFASLVNCLGCRKRQDSPWIDSGAAKDFEFEQASQKTTG